MTTTPGAGQKGPPRGYSFVSGGTGLRSAPNELETEVTLTIYHNPRCSKSREALALLEGKGLSPRVVEYLKTPPTEAELLVILKSLGVPARDVVRKKEAAALNIDPAQLSEAASVAAMVRHPEIIERPIVVNGGKAALGRPPERVLGIL